MRLYESGSDLREGPASNEEAKRGTSCRKCHKPYWWEMCQKPRGQMRPRQSQTRRPKAEADDLKAEDSSDYKS
ncbi:unnamed protein product [Protopolystoma xenopodis]|uniref:Uncharacterized protein n=1 Tax=Protopolystoma xenopodis TaxID=117903 RepID=A0A3S5B6J4_9PLAT|nr:unnamed protein product [Protopolystoma xenopodis]